MNRNFVGKKGPKVRRPKVDERDTKFADDFVPTGYTYVGNCTMVRDSDGSEFIYIKEMPLSRKIKREHIGISNFFDIERKKANNTFCIASEVQDEYNETFNWVWISKYPISMDENGLHSVKDGTPITNISFIQAKALASTFDTSKDVMTYLPCGCDIYMLVKQLERMTGINIVKVENVRRPIKKEGVERLAFNREGLIGCWTQETLTVKHRNHFIFGGIEMNEDGTGYISRCQANKYDTFKDVGFYVVLFPYEKAEEISIKRR